MTARARTVEVIRHLADAPISGRPVEVVLRVRRFFCDTTGCPAKTFAEQVPGVMTPDGVETNAAAWFNPAALSNLIMHPAMRLRVTDAVFAPQRTHFE